jgi:hypothetical protein
MGMANYLSLKMLRIVAFGFTIILTLVNTKAIFSTAAAIHQNSQFDLGIMGETIAFIKTTPNNEIWAYTDCGQFSFWSGRRFVNLDGLINNRDYQDHLRRGELGAYLRDSGVRYLVAGIWNRMQTENREYELMYKYRVAPEVYTGDYDSLSFYVYSYLYNTYSEKLLLPKTAEIWRSSEHVDGYAGERFIVYDLEKALGKFKSPANPADKIDAILLRASHGRENHGNSASD